MSDGETAIVVDVHEPDNLKVLSLDHPDIDKWLEPDGGLDAADLVVNGVGFERKTPSDFVSSLTDGRLHEQAEKLRDAYDHAYVLLEGSFDDFAHLEHSRLNAQSARGMAARLTADGIPVIPCYDRPTLIDMAVRLGRKHAEPASTSMTPSAAVADAPLGVRLWACFDGVGPTRAEALHEAIGSPTVPAWGTLRPEGIAEKLTEVEGIGEKTAERLTEQVLDE